MNRKITKFEISFDNDKNFFVSEQIISGKIIVNADVNVNLKGIKLQFIGECCVNICETDKKSTKDKLEAIKKNFCANYRLGGNNQKVYPIGSKENGETNFDYKNDSDLQNKELKINSNCENESKGDHSKIKNSFVKLLPIEECPDVKIPVDQKTLQICEQTNTSPTVNTDILTVNDRKIPNINSNSSLNDSKYPIKYSDDSRESGKENLSAGQHELPFAFRLPPNLPSSFSCDNAIIYYVTIATLHKTDGDLIIRKGFTVSSTLDLNREPSHITTSSTKSLTVNPCGLCVCSGPIHVRLMIPKQGYVPGETILVSADVDNVSASRIAKSTLSLEQIITIKMPNDVKNKKSQRPIKKIERGTFASGQSDRWEDINMYLPPLPASRIERYCKILKIEYAVEIYVEMTKPKKTLKVSLPVIIGTIPLSRNFADFLPSLKNSSFMGDTMGISQYNEENPHCSYAPSHFGEIILEEEVAKICKYRQEIFGSFWLNPAKDEEMIKTPFTARYIKYNAGNNINVQNVISG